MTPSATVKSRNVVSSASGSITCRFARNGGSVSTGSAKYEPNSDAEAHRGDAAAHEQIEEALHAGRHVDAVLDEPRAADEHRAVADVTDADPEEDEEERGEHRRGIELPVLRRPVEVGEHLEGAQERVVAQADRRVVALSGLFESEVDVLCQRPQRRLERRRLVRDDPARDHEGALRAGEVAPHREAVAPRVDRLDERDHAVEVLVGERASALVKAVGRLVDIGDALLRARDLLGGIVSEAGKADFGEVPRGERGTGLGRAARVRDHHPGLAPAHGTEFVDAHEPTSSRSACRMAAPVAAGTVPVNRTVESVPRHSRIW